MPFLDGVSYHDDHRHYWTWTTTSYRQGVRTTRVNCVACGYEVIFPNERCLLWDTLLLADEESEIDCVGSIELPSKIGWMDGREAERRWR